jgi:putative copper resistance protein D
MQSTVLLGGDWYSSLHLGWADPFDDQRLAGGILWAGGEVVSVTMLAVLVAQWMRHAEREARRVDRQLDREEAARSAAVTAVAAVTEVAAVAAVTEVAAVAAGAAPETVAGTGRREQDGYDPLGSRDTQGASGR